MINSTTFVETVENKPDLACILLLNYKSTHLAGNASFIIKKIFSYGSAKLIQIALNRFEIYNAINCDTIKFNPETVENLELLLLLLADPQYIYKSTYDQQLFDELSPDIAWHLNRVNITSINKRKNCD